MVVHGKYAAVNGIIVYDNTHIPDLPKDLKRITRRTIGVPASKLAIERFGNIMVSNMILMGAMIKSTAITDFETLYMAVREEVNPKYYDMNLEAIKLGASLTDKVFKPRIQRKQKRTIGFE